MSTIAVEKSFPTSTRSVVSYIFDKFASKGFLSSYLGFPTSQVLAVSITEHKYRGNSFIARNRKYRSEEAIGFSMFHWQSPTTATAMPYQPSWDSSSRPLSPLSDVSRQALGPGEIRLLQVMFEGPDCRKML